jgi:hypothetical protein
VQHCPVKPATAYLRSVLSVGNGQLLNPPHVVSHFVSQFVLQSTAQLFLSEQLSNEQLSAEQLRFSLFLPFEILSSLW